MHPLALVFLLVICAVVLLGGRRVAAAGLLAGVCLMTGGQMVVVGAVNLFFFRVTILAGLVRVTIRGDIAQFRRTALDLAVLLWVSVLLVSSAFRQDPFGHAINSLGDAGSTAVAYVVFRALIQNIEDVWNVGKWLIYIVTLLSVAMLLERLTGHSAFAMFGGVETAVRNGSFRAVGPFRHAILAGSTGAALVPLVAAFWPRHRQLSILGLGACTAIVFSSGSSGPILALLAGLVALGFWRYPHYRRAALWGAVATAICLQVVMKPNVWYLIARIDFVGGSTGWHRAYLVDQALVHFDEWWLIGTDRTRHWMPTGVGWSADQADITNHYLWLGVKGGLALVLAHCGVLAIAFKSVGGIRARNRAAPAVELLMVWALGSVLFAHVVNSWGVAYFDQSVVLVYFILACIGSLASNPLALTSGSTPSVVVQVRQPLAPHRTRRRLTRFGAGRRHAQQQVK